MSMLMHWHIAQLVLKQGISVTIDGLRRKLSTQLRPCRLRMTPGRWHLPSISCLRNLIKWIILDIQIITTNSFKTTNLIKNNINIPYNYNQYMHYMQYMQINKWTYTYITVHIVFYYKNIENSNSRFFYTLKLLKFVDLVDLKVCIVKFKARTKSCL